MSVTETVLPPFSKKPLAPMVKPALFSTCLAAAALPVAETVFDATGPLQAEKVGSVMPVLLSTAFSRPASPSDARSERFTARLIAFRTASWLVGHLFRFGIKAFVLPGASQKW